MKNKVEENCHKFSLMRVEKVLLLNYFYNVCRDIRENIKKKFPACLKKLETEVWAKNALILFLSFACSFMFSNPRLKNEKFANDGISQYFVSHTCWIMIFFTFVELSAWVRCCHSLKHRQCDENLFIGSQKTSQKFIEINKISHECLINVHYDNQQIILRKKFVLKSLKLAKFNQMKRFLAKRTNWREWENSRKN